MGEATTLRCGVASQKSTTPHNVSWKFPMQYDIWQSAVRRSFCDTTPQRSVVVPPYNFKNNNRMKERSSLEDGSTVLAVFIRHVRKYNVCMQQNFDIFFCWARFSLNLCSPNQVDGQPLFSKYISVIGLKYGQSRTLSTVKVDQRLSISWNIELTF